MSDAGYGAGLDPVLLEVLACPACHGPLSAASDPALTAEMRCPACELSYPVRDGIPVLLADEGRSTTGPEDGA